MAGNGQGVPPKLASMKGGILPMLTDIERREEHDCRFLA